MGTRLAALVVNYNSGRYALRCVESVQRAWAEERRDPADLEVVVVDNASPEDQEPWLAALEARGATVVRHGENAGYARGANLALARTSGGPDDVVAVLNADVFFMPGALGALIGYLLEHRDVGVIDPRHTIDPRGLLAMPLNMLPTPANELRLALARLTPALCRAYSRRRVRLTLPWWTERRPVDADMLCGATLLLRRAVIAELPALLDERYPLFYEDTDLFTTLRRKGWRVVHHGGAHVLHHWSRSATPGGAYGGAVLEKYRASKRAYFRKLHGRLGAALVGLVERLAAAWPASLALRPMHALVELGAHDAPLEIRLPRDCTFLLELSNAPVWLLTVGITGRGDRFVFPADTWEWLFRTDYYVRALDLDTGALLGAWHFTKTSPGRDAPLEPAEIAALWDGASST